MLIAYAMSACGVFRFAARDIDLADTTIRTMHIRGAQAGRACTTFNKRREAPGTVANAGHDKTTVKLTNKPLHEFEQQHSDTCHHHP